MSGSDEDESLVRSELIPIRRSNPAKTRPKVIAQIANGLLEVAFLLASMDGGDATSLELPFVPEWMGIISIKIKSSCEILRI